MGWRESGIAILANKNKLSDETKRKSDSYARWLEDERSGAHAGSYVDTSDPMYEEFSQQMLHTPSSARRERQELSRQARANLSDGITPLWKRQASAPASFTEELRKMYGRPSGVDYGKNPYNAEWRSNVPRREQPQASFRSVSDDMKARFRQSEDEWNRSGFAELGRTDAAIRYAKMSNKDREALSPTIRSRLEGIYREESKMAEDYAKQTGSSGRGDAYFSSFSDSYGLGLPSLLVRAFGSDTAKQNDLYNELNALNHSVSAGIGDVTGWVMPGGINSAVAKGVEKGLKPVANAAEKGVVKTIAKATGKDAVGLALSKPAAIAARGAQRAASSALTGFGAGAATGAIKSAASGNEAGQVAKDALRQGRDFAVAGAIGGGIGGAIEGSRISRTMNEFAEQYMKAGGDDVWGSINNWYRGVKPSSGVPVTTAKQSAPLRNISSVVNESSNLSGAVNSAATKVRGDLIKPVAENAPVRAGQATTIKKPYSGPTPSQTTTDTLATVSIPDASVSTAQNVVNMAKDAENGKIKRAAVRKAYEQIFDQKGGQKQVAVKDMTMDGQPYVVDVNKSSVRKVISDSNLNIQKLAVLDNVENVISNGRYVGSSAYERKGEKKKLTTRFDYFETPVNIGDQEYVAAFDVEVFPNVNNYRTHKVINKMNLQKVTNADLSTNTAQTKPSVSSIDNSIPSKDDVVKDSIAQTGRKDVHLDQYASEPERWTAQNRNETAVNASIPDIVEYIKKNFDIPISTGNIREKDARGIFKPRPEAIRTKVANALPTISHELGHYADKKFNLSGVSSIDEAIRAMEPDFAARYDERQLPGEAIAEFMRTYLSDKTVAEKRYPSFFSEFVSRVDKDTMKKLETLADMVNGYLSSDMESAMASAITSRTAKNKLTISERLTNLYNAYMDNVIDDLYPLQQLEKEAKGELGELSVDMRPYMKAMNARSTPGIVKYAIEKALVDRDGNKVYDGLSTILSAIDSNKMDKFEQYLVAKHAVDWLTPDENGKTKRVFADDRINNAEYQSSLAERLEADNPEFKKTAERYYEFNRIAMKLYCVDSGLMSADTFNKLQQKYPHYVPLYRAVKTNILGAKRGYANQNAPIKRAKGSGEAIYSPLENTVIHLDRSINAAKRNGVMQSVAKLYDSIEGFGKYIEEVPPDQIAYSVDLRGKKKQLSDAFGNNEEIDEFFNSVLSDYETGFKPYANGGKNILTVMQNGDKRYFQVHNKRLYNALTADAPERINPVLQALDKGSIAFKAVTTGLNPWFGANNTPRDLQTAYVYTEAGMYAQAKNTLYAFGEMLVSPFVESRDYELYKAVGGGYNTPISASRTEFKSLLRELKDTNPALLHKLLKKTSHPVELLEAFNNLSETPARLGEFKSMLEAGKTLEEALFAANDVTVNHRRHGKVTRRMETILPYTNAAVQGVDKQIRAFINHPVKTMAKMLTLAIPFMLSYTLMDEEDKKAYKRLSPYMRNNFHLFAIGDGFFGRIAKPRELALLSNIVERSIEYFFMENEQAFSGFGDWLWSAYVPFDGLSSVMLFGNAYDIARNKDFAGRPIVPASMEKLEARDQYDENTTWIAKKSGELLGLSPKKVDFVINQNTGFIGRMNKALGTEKKDWTFGMDSQYIVDSVYSTDILNNFYDSKEKNDKAYYSGKLVRGEKDDVVEKHMQDMAVSGVLSTYNKFIKAESDLGKKRELKKKQLEVIEEGKYTQSFPEVIELYKVTGESVFPFNDMDIEYEYSVKNKSGKVLRKIPVSLTAEQYTQCLDDMNKEILDEYQKAITNGYPYNKKQAEANKKKNAETDEEKVKLLKTIKSDIKSKYKEKYGKEADQ